MKNTNHKKILTVLSLFVAFVLWTIAIRYCDVQAIGPENSSVGFAHLNGFFHNVTGEHMLLYTVTDWLGLIPLCTVLYFGFLGFLQLCKRKSLKKVDRDLLILGGFYILVMAAYLFFEIVPINYRPVLIDGCLEASYPSSTTLLVLCVMPTALMQLHSRIKNITVRNILASILSIFTIFMVIARLISGVHWLTDIIGGILLSAALVILYHVINSQKKQTFPKDTFGF